MRRRGGPIGSIPGRALATRLAAALVVTASVATAQPKAGKAPAPPPAPAPAPAPAPPKSSAIVHVAGAIAEGLGQVPSGAIVVASPVTSDIPAPKGDELAARIAAQIAGKLDAARAHHEPAALAAARGLSGRAASLVYVQLEIAKGELRATADLYPVVSNGWERLRNPAPEPRAHAFAAAAIDAEVRTFLAPVLLEQASVHKAKHDEGEVLAIGCGDVDADGGLELVVVTRSRVALAKLKAGKLVVTRATPWALLASRAPVPLREPIASVEVSPRGHRGEIFVGITDRTAVALDASLTTRKQLTGLPIPGAGGDACARAFPDQSSFDANGVACTAPVKGEPPVVLLTPVPRFDAVAALDLVGKDGAVTEVVAAREPGGRLRLRRGDASPTAPSPPAEATLDNVGSQVVLADLDQDGVAEVVTSAESGEDAITVASWRDKGLATRLRLPAKEGVRAIAACAPEARGAPAIVAVVGSEVWLVR